MRSIRCRRELRYYSLVTFPQPERISSILTSSYDKLARIDGRNDSQVIFYDQVVPGSALVGYVNADHWALAVPIARTHSMIGALFVTHNDYPREALMEALLRFVEEHFVQSRPMRGVPTGFGRFATTYDVHADLSNDMAAIARRQRRA